MSDSILLVLLLLSLKILHVEIKELRYVLRLITTNSPKDFEVFADKVDARPDDFPVLSHPYCCYPQMRYLFILRELIRLPKNE